MFQFIMLRMNEHNINDISIKRYKMKRKITPRAISLINLIDRKFNYRRFFKIS